MSLLNQVLRDLDAQDQPLSPKPSLRLANNTAQVEQRSSRRSYKWPLITLISWVLLIIVAAVWWWLREPPRTIQPLPAGTPQAIESVTPIVTPAPPSPIGSTIGSKGIAVTKDQPSGAPAPELASAPIPLETEPTGTATVPAETQIKSVEYLPLHINEPRPVVPGPRKVNRAKPVARPKSTARPTLHKTVVTRPLDKVRELIDQGALSHAEELLREQLAKGSREPAAHELLIGLMVQSGRPAEALGQIEKSLRILKQNSSLELLRSRLLIEQGHPKQALAGLDRLLTREPGNRQALRLNAGLLQQSGSTGEARNLYQRLTRLPDAIASDWLGLALTQDGKDSALAAAAYRRVLGYPQLGDEVRQFARQRLEALQ